MANLVPKIYSPREELLNVISHAAGVLLALAGTSLLLSHAAGMRDVFAGLVYGLSLIILFSGSALYHGARIPEKRERLRLLDHSAIYFLIAGTYTPLMLCIQHGTAEIVVLIAVWSLALIGVSLELLKIKPFKGFTIILYTLMGWACLAVLPQLIQKLPDNAFSVLLAGGIAYTLGIPFYIMRKEFCHAVWHFFVLAGAVLHFSCIYLVFLN